MDRGITEILLKNGVKHHSINQSINQSIWRSHLYVFIIFSPTAKRPASYCHDVSVVGPSVPMSVCSSMCESVNLFFKKTSQKLLTRSLHNFTGMFLRWTSFKFFQIIVFHVEFWLPW